MKKSTYWLLVILGFIVACILLTIGKNSFGTYAKVFNTLGCIAFTATPVSYFLLATINYIKEKLK